MTEPTEAYLPLPERRGSSSSLAASALRESFALLFDGPKVVLSEPATAPLGTLIVFPAEQDEHHQRQIAIRWAPPYDLDEQYPWLILGSEGPQRLSHDVVDGCEVLSTTAVAACRTAVTG